MGSGVSSISETPGGDLRLPNSGLHFTRTQLQHLNAYVENLYQQDQLGRMSPEMESTVETLVQRIVDGAGQRDPRFRCCHLIALHRERKMRSRSLEYLVTLDALSKDCTHARGTLRPRTSTTAAYEDLLTTSGLLCRDSVLSRWTELIAKCAQARGGGSSRALDSSLIVAEPYHYCYLERVTPLQLPEQRLAIVEGAAWVMVRVGADGGEAKLMLGARLHGGGGGGGGAGGGGGPESLPPFTHPHALLHYTAADTDMYAVAVAPTAAPCGDRSASWQLWRPGFDAGLDSHCADESTVGRVAGAINCLLDRLRAGAVQGSLRVLSRECARRAARARWLSAGGVAGGTGGVTGGTAARVCVSAHASHHFLLILDDLIAVCSNRNRQLSRRGMRASEADWKKDATCLMNLLKHLHTESVSAEEIPPTVTESLETALFRRWENILKEMKSSNANPPNYTRLQLKYIWRLATALIKCKARMICDDHSTFRANLLQATSIDQEPVEDLIHILAIMLDQARDLYLSKNFPQKHHQVNDFERDLTIYRSKKWNKLKDYYDASSACLIDAVRRDPDLRKENLTDECTLIKNVLNWLYKGAKDDKKYLGPVLKPYLENLFASSLENSMFLEDFDSRKCEKELEGLKSYCLAVHEGKIDPCVGLLEISKKMTWAKTMVDFVDRAKHTDLRLVFPTGEGMAISYTLKLPSRRESSARALTLSRRDKAEAKLRLARRCVLAAFNDALMGDRSMKTKELTRCASTDEILASAKSGLYWRSSSKPDVVPPVHEPGDQPVLRRRSSSKPDVVPPVHEPGDQPVLRRRSRRSRPSTTYGYPDISISHKTDTKTLRRKYHTLRSLVYTEPVESISEMKRRPHSASSTVRSKETMTRPSILETLDFINGVKDELCVYDSCTSETEEAVWTSISMETCLRSRSQPLSVIARTAATVAAPPHYLLAGVVNAMLARGKFTILQELCTWLGESREGALFALHRLARAARSRSSDRPNNSWQLVESVDAPAPPQTYRARSPDDTVGDLPPPPPPPPPPRDTSHITATQRKYMDYTPPKRLQELENHLKNLELMHAKLNLPQKLTKNHTSTNFLNESYTGIINPVYDERKIPKDKFSAKRSKSLGRSFSARKLGLEIPRYNLTLGHKSGQKTNDVVTAMMGTSGESGLEAKSNFFQRHSSATSVVGDSYRLSRVTID